MTEKAIYTVLERAENRAKEAISSLGMADEMKKHNMWETPPICKNILEINIEDEEDDENDKEQEDDNEDENNDSVADLVTDIEQLHELKIVDSSVVENVEARQRGLKKEKIAETGIPTYTKSTTSENDTMPNFVEVKAGNKVVYIRKRSAVWLF